MRRVPLVVASVGLVAVAAAVAFLATRPLGGIGPAGPGASAGGAGFYPLGSPTGRLALGEPAPEFVAADGTTPILADLDGQPVKLADLAGRPLWIVFWATWCTPCQQEAASIRSAFHAHEEALGVLAIDVREPAVAVRDYAQAHDLDYPVALDSTGEVMALYRAGGLPAHLFLDSRGVLVDRYFGQLTAELMEKHLRALVGG